MTAADGLRQVRRSCSDSLGVFLKDVGHGLLEIGHNSLALVGLGVVAMALFAAGRADLRVDIERLAFGWLLERHEAREADPDTLFFNRRLVVEGDTEFALLVKNTLDTIDIPRTRGILKRVLRAAAAGNR